MFNALSPAPADPIFGLNAAFAADDRPHKVNLGIGVYQDEQGRTPVLRAVRAAEQRLAERGDTKSYLPISGAPAYGDHVQRLLFGEVQDNARTAQTPGGTGALRVAGDLVAQTAGPTRVWLPSPSWANHQQIFAAAGHEIQTYAYYDPARTGLDEDAMLSALATVGAGDVVLLHGCCHNPTGFDPSPATWGKIADLAGDKGWLPLVDLAYQGFGEGLDHDVQGLRTLTDALPEVLVASSFSKNFGLYSERAGALTMVGADAARAELVFGHIKRAVRANYSNPPRHAEALVVTVLDDASLRADWSAELDTMRDRITSMRRALAEQLGRTGRDFSFLLRQRGMFGFTGLSPAQVDRLQGEHAIYMVRSGRINVAGLNPHNLDQVASAIAAVL